MIKVTQENFKNIIEENKKVILDFWAPWCNPCMALGPIMEEVNKNYPDVVFGKINVDEEEELAQAFKVYSIPYVVKFVDGKMVDQFVGLHDEVFVEGFFEK